MLLVLFLLAVQLGPAAHLAFHRDDHTHGAGISARAHAGAHRAGLAHVHHRADPRRAAPVTPDPAREERPGHGQGNSAHFGLALLDAPPSPGVPRPAERLVVDAAPALRPPFPPDRQAPPVRGPPPLASC